MDDIEKGRELSEFQIRNIQILTHLLQNNAVSDEIVECLRQSELEYFSLVDKYHLLEQKVNIDEKTNLLKYKSDYLTTIVKTASRVFYGVQGVSYSVSFIRFDIDNFSQFNNRYGHEVGDEMLIRVATVIKDNSRPTDYVIRFGGEEIDVILPSTELRGAIDYCEKIFEKISEISLKRRKEVLKVSVSAGISSTVVKFGAKRHINAKDVEKLYRDLQMEADNALYEAKYLGKNKYCVYDPKKKEDYGRIRKLYVKKE